MNRHEDDDATGHPSSHQSSRHGSSLLKYDDITILIGKYTFSLTLKNLQLFCLEALTGQQYELKCSPTESVLSIKSKFLRSFGIFSLIIFYK